MLRLFRYALLCLATVVPLSAAASGYTITYTHHMSPSNLGGSTTFSENETFPLRHYIGCIDAFTGNPLRCTFSYRILGLAPLAGLLANNGGHAHGFDTHPLTWPADGKLKYNLMEYPLLTGIPEKDGATLGDAGSDDPGAAEVHYIMPEVAGKPQSELFIIAPPHWFCLYACYTLNSWHYIGTLDVGVEDLVELPVGSYYNLTGDKPEHPSNHFGLLEMNFRIVETAARYYSDPTLPGNPKVGVNDGSLPEGGLFDLHFDLTWPHQTHRKGIEVDFDRMATLSDGSSEWVDKYALDDASAAAGLVLHEETAANGKCSKGTDEHPCFHLDLDPAF